MAVADFLSHFFSWGDLGLAVTQRMNDFAARLDAHKELLLAIKGEQEKMALDFTKLVEEITRIASVRDKIAADVAALRASFSNADDQAKVDEFAASLKAELDSLDATVAGIAPVAPAPAPEPAPEAPVDVPVEPQG